MQYIFGYFSEYNLMFSIKNLGPEVYRLKSTTY